MKKLVALALLLSTVLLSSSAMAGGFSNADIGMRRVGMFAVVGRPDDVTAIFHNPAGLLLGEGTRLYHAQTWFLVDLALRMYDSGGQLRPEHEISPDWNVGWIPFIGVDSDFGTDNFRAGLAVYAPNVYGAAMPEDEPTRYHATRVLFLASRATASAAYRISDKFFVGASASLVHVYLTATQKYSEAVYLNPDARFAPYEETKATDLTLELDGQDFTWAVDLGVLFRPVSSLRLGAAFAGGTAATLEGDVTVTSPDGQSQSVHHSTTIPIPFTLSAGLNWEFAKDFEFGTDIRYWHYDVFQEQRSELDGELLVFGPDSPMISPRNYGNSWNWCVGMLHRLTPSLEVMVGYQQDYTPIPEETYSLDNPSRDQHGVSLGLRWQMDRKWRFGLAAIRNWFDMVDVQRSTATPPANAKGHGASLNLGFDIQYQL